MMKILCWTCAVTGIGQILIVTAVNVKSAFIGPVVPEQIDGDVLSRMLLSSIAWILLAIFLMLREVLTLTEE